MESSDWMIVEQGILRRKKSKKEVKSGGSFYFPLSFSILSQLGRTKFDSLADPRDRLNTLFSAGEPNSPLITRVLILELHTQSEAE